MAPINKLQFQSRMLLPSLLISLSVLTQCGCSGNEFDVAKASGTIKTESGETIESGIITFTPTQKDEAGMSGKSAFGKIENGQFVLTTYNPQDGAVVGKHRITLTEAWRPDEEDVDANTKISKRHGCVISPDLGELEVLSGENNVFELVAVPKKRRKRGEAEEDD